MKKKWAAIVIAAAAVAIFILQRFQFLPAHPQSVARTALFEEIQPIALVNCEMARFGAEHDGGYLLCDNLLDEAEIAYSYGIGGEDSWGCSLSRRHQLTVHQYDCFDLREPICPGGAFAFHPECVGNRKKTIEGREFDTVANQVAKNGDSGKRLVVKMDVEGAEWDSLLATPESLLNDVGQLVVEFHRVHKESYLDVVRRLKEHFYVAHLHFNNHTCLNGIEPFPAWAYEVLLVNKRIAERDESGATPAVPNPLDRPNNPGAPDCQTAG